MIEISPSRKNKVLLSDYDYQRDIENRLLMAQFSTLDLEVMEEILYSSLNIPIRKLTKSLEIDEESLFKALEKLRKTDLIKIDNETIHVDKEMRKYYESQILKFDDEFTPGMEFLQSLLRKVPIHVLPNWYSISRTSNNIFDSIIEKYLLTPHIFQRYLLELNFGNPTLSGIIDDVFHAPDFHLSSQELIKKYSLTRGQFEECMLYLEFNFVCCLVYKKVDDHWEEMVTPFHEWREYLRFLRDTEAPMIKDPSSIKRRRPHDFSFIQDMEAILTIAKKEPIRLSSLIEDKLTPERALLGSLAAACGGFSENDPSLLPYIRQIFSKLSLLKFADDVDGYFYALESANDWLDMRPENRALFIYRHPLNRLLVKELPASLYTERSIHEAEKGISRVLRSGWVYFDDFVKGALIPLNEASIVMLKRSGKSWKYSLPHYTEEEVAFIKNTLFEGLFEIGALATGVCDGKECFCVTPFGQSLFGR
jgi:hypothetical protein